MLRLAPAIAVLLMIGPICAGLAATFLPAFGYFPALGGNEFSIQPIEALIEKPGLWRSVLLSIKVALISTIVSLVLASLLFAGWYSTRSFRALQSFISPLLSVPHAAAAFGVAFLIAPSGWLMRLISPELTGFTRPPDYHFPGDPGGWALILGLIVKELPFLVLISLAAWPQLRAPQKLQVTAGLGYDRFAGFFLAVWPQMYAQIRLAVFAVIAFSSSVVDVALILGPSSPPTLSVRLLTWMNDPDISQRFLASAGAVLQLLTTFFCMMIWLGLEKIFKQLSRFLTNKGWRGRAEKTLRTLSICLASGLIALMLMGFCVLAIWSFAGFWRFPDALPQAWNLKTWITQLGTMETIIGNTIIIGLCATLFAAILSIACLEREARCERKHNQRSLLLLYIPLLIPQIAFVFGLQLFALASGLQPGFLSVILVHLVFVLPYLFLSLSDSWRALDSRYSQVCSGLGQSANKFFWKVRLPLLTRSILIAIAVGFSVSIGQYLTTALVGAGRLPTVTTEAVALASGGNRRVVGTYAFLQMLLPLIAFMFAAIIPALLFKNRRDLKVS